MEEIIILKVLITIFNMGLVVFFIYTSIQELRDYLEHIKNNKKEDRFLDLGEFKIFSGLAIAFISTILAIWV